MGRFGYSKQDLYVKLRYSGETGNQKLIMPGPVIRSFVHSTPSHLFDQLEGNSGGERTFLCSS
jgi:hypothetical protein